MSQILNSSKEAENCPGALPWCRCGVCQIMPQEIENKCCTQWRCVTTHSRFSKLCLDPDDLQLASEIGGTSGMTAMTTAPVPLERQHIGSMFWIGMAI